MENKPRPCGCKGKRTCLICENEFGLSITYVIKQGNSYVYCPECNKAYPGWDVDSYKSHPNHDGDPISYPGIFIQMDFISREEEDVLVQGIDEMPWDQSQSGRRKQNFGPKCNFKKQKLKPGTFQGFPAFTKYLQDRFEEYPLLSGYKTIEQCSLEYDPNRGASIDPHIDDCWVWGERIVTINLLSDSVLTMTVFSGSKIKYNLSCVPTYPPVLDPYGRVIASRESNENSTKLKDPICETMAPDVVVRVPMPARSLLVIYGQARYNWEHCVLREDILSRRLCLAYREFTPPFLPSGMQAKVGEEVLKQASLFWDHKQLQLS